MITSSLFDDVLIQPVQQGADRLLVVSGYASSAMVSFHFDRVREKKKELSVKLIVGMCGRDGLPVSYHRGFQKLALEDYPQNFECSYIYRSAPVHSKVYIWLKDEEPFASFAGSANYTQIAFGSKQREVLAPCDPHQSLAYFKSLEPDSIFCSDPDAETEIRIYSDPQYFKRPKEAIDAGEGLQTMPEYIETPSFPCVRVSLLDRYGDLPQRSGLNWGQRPEEGREPNQAYISLKADVYRTDFFPPRKARFTVITDDGKALICTRAQDNGKAIHTPQNNSQIGEYFRNRLGVASGARITKKHLADYGRFDLVFCKLDDETYSMDFSV